ncbi:tRNA (guanine-N(7)-)-methyltransferase non-catalytic subunit wdr4 [Smittium mucronatum]|uniref:tRNA (Guanine-N(7)-)-methyltransferase non-catalytic subunit wdr4 n=1 Tax=Smittium mucronatum TaxID=133383 RepID=A0A1R0GXR3_9FUNG|nr:tRNA (guanine-N(7)-)-methyltransferase non-catalytic subunit wdr4 [Smittium mucronatum]
MINEKVHTEISIIRFFGDDTAILVSAQTTTISFDASEKDLVSLESIDSGFKKIQFPALITSQPKNAEEHSLETSNSNVQSESTPVDVSEKTLLEKKTVAKGKKANNKQNNKKVTRVAEDPSKFVIRDLSVSNDLKLLALITENKQLYIYETKNWTLVNTTENSKKCNSVIFDPKGEFVLVADKFGDAYRYPISIFPQPLQPELLLGHVSILTTLSFIKVSKRADSNENDEYMSELLLVSGDRDEKLRLSSYPNCYNIHSYCLGHKEFVSALDVPNFPSGVSKSLLISGAGDGTVKLWDVSNNPSKSGPSILLQSLDMPKIGIDCPNMKELSEVGITGIKSCRTSTNDFLVAVIVESVPSIFLFKLKVDLVGLNSTLVLIEILNTDSAMPELSDVSTNPSTNNVPVAIGFDIPGRLFVSYAIDSKNHPSKKIEAFDYDSSIGKLVSCEDKIRFTNLITPTVEVAEEPKSIFEWGRKSYARDKHNKE